MSFDSLSPALRDRLLLGVVAAVLFVTNLGGAPLFDEDEPKNAACAAAMFRAGEWIVPTFNGELRVHKPILLYWVTRPGYNLFGVNEFGARIGSAVLAVGVVLLTHMIGLRLFVDRQGRGDRVRAGMAAAMLATGLMFVVIARCANPDATLMICTTGALWCFVEGLHRRYPGFFKGERWASALRSDERDGDAYPPEGLRPPLAVPRWPWLAGCYACMGAAVLAKGPVGVVLPTTALVAFVALANSERRIANRSSRLGLFATRCSLFARRLAIAVTAMRPDVAILCVLAVAGPWYVAVTVATDGAWPAGFLGKHNVHRFLNTMEGHGGGPLYYVAAVGLGFFPWSLLLPAAATRGVAAVRRGLVAPGPLLAWCWALTYLIFFSVAKTKLPNYVLPCYPALALITAHFAAGWRPNQAGYPAWWTPAFFGSIAAVGIVATAGLPVVTTQLLGGVHWVAVLGLIPIVGGLAAWRAFDRGEVLKSRVILGGGTAAFAAAAFWLAAPAIGRHQEAVLLVDAARADRGRTTDRAVLARTDEPSPPIALFGHWAPNFTFYARDDVKLFDRAEDLAAYLAENPAAYVAARGDRLPEIESVLGDDRLEVADVKRFLRSHRVKLFAPPVREVAVGETVTTRN